MITGNMSVNFTAVKNADGSYTTTPTSTKITMSEATTSFLMGVNLSGGEFGQLGQAFNVGYTYPTHMEVDYYSSKGMKVIRLPFLIERVQPSMNAALDPTELSRIDDIVTYATSKGLHVLLDAHNYGRIFGLLIADTNTYTAFANFWGQMAGHYKNNSNVMFGLMNEPNVQSATQWLPAVNQAITAIRNTGANQVITVPGSYWSGAWTWTTSDNAGVVGMGTKDPLNNIMFEVHQYLDSDGSGTHYSDPVAPTLGVDRLSAATAWAEQNGKKLFLGECGVTTSPDQLTALGNMLAYMKLHLKAWAGFTYWSGGPWWGGYPFSIEPSSGIDKPQIGILQK